jgi:hypothetical protein
MQIYEPEYRIKRLTPQNYNTEKTRTKITCRFVVTGFFNIGDRVEVTDLKKLERTTEIRILKSANVALLANSLFTENANRYAILQEIDKSTADLLTREAVETARQNLPYKKNNFIIKSETKIVLMSVIQDEFIESLKNTEQKKLF